MSAPDSDTITEWSVRVVSKKNALGESYTILLFLGEVPNDPEDWRMSPNLVGTHYVMTHSRPAPDPHDDFEVEGIIPLNMALEDHLPSLATALVVPYVRRNIHWRIQKVSGDVVDNAVFPIRVMTFSVDMKYDPREGTHIQVGKPKEFPECTTGIDGK